MQTSIRNTNIKKIAVILGVLLLVAGGAVYGYNYWNKHHYKGNPAERLPGIDYSAAKPEDNKAINEKKANNQIDSQSSTQTDKSIGIVFAASGQDTPQGPLVIRTLLSNVKDGKCSLTVQRNDQVITRIADVIQQGNYFTCDGFMIPYNELTAGDWQISVKVTTSAGAENVAKASATIK